MQNGNQRNNIQRNQTCQLTSIIISPTKYFLALPLFCGVISLRKAIAVQDRCKSVEATSMSNIILHVTVTNNSNDEREKSSSNTN